MLTHALLHTVWQNLIDNVHLAMPVTMHASLIHPLLLVLVDCVYYISKSIRLVDGSIRL